MTPRRTALKIAIVTLAQIVGPSAMGQVSRTYFQDENAYPLNDQSSASSQPMQTSTSVAPGRTADTGTGQIGQRQVNKTIAPNFTPLGRIDSRVANRVQSRIRNRIDRDYDPRANAVSPFKTANDRTRVAGTQPR